MGRSIDLAEPGEEPVSESMPPRRLHDFPAMRGIPRICQTGRRQPATPFRTADNRAYSPATEADVRRGDRNEQPPARQCVTRGWPRHEKRLETEVTSLSA